MGVDYTGNYGIGVKVIKKEFSEDSEYFEEFNTYLDDVLENTNYYYFEVGDYYEGETDFYICINEVFSEGYNIAKKALDLYSFLAENEVEYIGKVDEVGGLLID